MKKLYIICLHNLTSQDHIDLFNAVPHCSGDRIEFISTVDEFANLSFYMHNAIASGFNHLYFIGQNSLVKQDLDVINFDNKTWSHLEAPSTAAECIKAIQALQAESSSNVMNRYKQFASTTQNAQSDVNTASEKSNYAI